jgi:cytochrome P450
VFHFLDRKCCSDYTLPYKSGKGTVILPAGKSIFIPLLGLQNDRKYFPDPDKFDSHNDKFTEENKQSRPSYTRIPFGEGPRMCIGKDKHTRIQDCY